MRKIHHICISAEHHTHMSQCPMCSAIQLDHCWIAETATWIAETATAAEEHSQRNGSHRNERRAYRNRFFLSLGSEMVTALFHPVWCL